MNSDPSGLVDTRWSSFTSVSEKDESMVISARDSLFDPRLESLSTISLQLEASPSVPATSALYL